MLVLEGMSANSGSNSWSSSSSSVGGTSYGDFGGAGAGAFTGQYAPIPIGGSMNVGGGVSVPSFNPYLGGP